MAAIEACGLEALERDARRRNEPRLDAVGRSRIHNLVAAFLKNLRQSKRGIDMTSGATA